MRQREEIQALLPQLTPLAGVPGNVRLKKGEANLPRVSVVNVTQIRTIDRDKLDHPIGALSPRRIRQVLGGLSLVVE